MKTIKKTALIANEDGEKFCFAVSKLIDEYQLLGLEVEVQYQMSALVYSALIIAR
jgi:hypothetical protein